MINYVELAQNRMCLINKLLDLNTYLNKEMGEDSYFS